jgi:cell division septum initiation protein DivIVA
MAERASTCTPRHELGRRSVIVNAVDILYLLDQLEEVLGAGSRVPLTSRTLVDEQEVLDILDQIRVSIPDELTAARRLTQDRDQVIADAQSEADRILRDAEAEAASRVSDHNLARAAELHAADIEDRALHQAAQVRREADAYAHRVLQKLRDQIEQVRQTVDRGLAELETREVRDEIPGNV